MDIDRGKVHQEVDKIVGQQPGSGSQEDGMRKFRVVIARYAIHYVEARDGDEAIMHSLRRRPDAEDTEVDVTEGEDGEDASGGYPEYEP